MWDKFDVAVKRVLQERCDCGSDDIAVLHHDLAISEYGHIDDVANENWRENGQVCEWEHRIELEPTRERDRGGRACFLFGHECPGGLERARMCRERFDQLVGNEARG